MKHITDRPIASKGLLSYRYKASYSWIMIGARDDADALREAKRSTHKEITIDNLQIWNGTEYTPVKGAA